MIVNSSAHLISGERQVVENERVRPIVVFFADVLFLTLQLLQRMLHPHHRVVVVAFVVRYASEVDAVCHCIITIITSIQSNKPSFPITPYIQRLVSLAYFLF